MGLLKINIISYNNKDIVLETWASLKSLDKLIEPKNNTTLEFGDKKDDEEIKEFEEDSDDEINKKRLEFGKIMCPNTKIKIIKFHPFDRLCNICLEDHKNKVNWISLYCSHKFHHECITAWKQENKQCPICNTEINIISDSLLSINI